MFHTYVSKNLIVCYFVLGVIINAVADISLDYYFGKAGSSRSHNRQLGQCRGPALILTCQKKCDQHYACFLDRCFCVILNNPPKELVLLETSKEDTASESMDDDEDDEDSLRWSKTEDSEDVPEKNVETEGYEVPILRRHHIAHFCPNLDDARKCIRKCQERGLPAFCGKDHNCYCGHCYDFPCKPVNVSASQSKSVYYDLYEKYFGPKKDQNQIFSTIENPEAEFSSTEPKVRSTTPKVAPIIKLDNSHLPEPYNNPLPEPYNTAPNVDNNASSEKE